MMSLFGCSMSGWYGCDQPTAASAQSALSGLTYRVTTSQTDTATHTTGSIWYQWTTGTATSSTLTQTALQTVWYGWSADRCGSEYRQTAPQVAQLAPSVEPLSPAEEEQIKSEAAKRAEAGKRAEELLIASLDDQQKQQYLKERFFTVISKDGQRKYRIRTGRSRNVDLLDDEGKRVISYCAHPAEAVPDQDTMLAQKLMIEHAEEEFLRVANAS